MGSHPSSASSLETDCGHISSLSLNFFICTMGMISPPRGQVKLVHSKPSANGQSFQDTDKMEPNRLGSNASSSFSSCVTLGKFTPTHCPDFLFYKMRVVRRTLVHSDKAAGTVPGQWQVL